MPYIELNRTLVSAAEKGSDHEFEAMFDAELLRKSGSGWPDVLKNRFVLILGSAGVGKTTEMKHQADKLVAEGRRAFFARLEDIAAEGLVAALRAQDREAYEDWLNSGDQAVFFLDSVDEAKIEAYGDFNRALNKFVSAVNPAAARVNVVLSCRPSDWQHVTDHEFVKAALAPLANVDVPVASEEGVELRGISDEDAAVDVESEEMPAGKGRDIELIQLQLRPLDRAQVLRMAKALGLTDAEAFVAALEEKENLSLAATPRDVEWLTEYWCRHKSIGLLWDMLSTSVEERLRERNENYRVKDTLPPEQSRTGTERIAGANVLCREPHVRIFDPALTTVTPKGLDAEKLLPEFPPKLLGNLLRRAIYNEMAAGRVRIDPKGTRAFLAGTWLLRLIADGAPRTKIQPLLMRSVYGREMVVPSMIETAAWVACQDSSIRAHLIRVAPEAALFMGDAATVPVEERIEAIKSFARKYSGTHKFDWVVDDVDYARAAHPAMDETVNKLLKQKPTSIDVAKLLLRFTSVGKLPKSATSALGMALGSNVKSNIRVWAIDAVAHAGTDAQRAKLRAAVLNGHFKEDRLIERASRELFPRTLSLGDLDAILDLFTVANPDAVGGPSHTVANYWTDSCPTDQLNAMLAMLVRKVQTEPLRTQEGFAPLLSAKYGWLIDAVGKCARKIIENHAATDPGSVTVLTTALTLVEKAKDQRGFRVYGADEIEAALKKNEVVRRAYIASRVLASARRRNFLIGCTLSRPFTGDAAWLLAEAGKTTTDAKRGRLILGALEVWAMTGRPAELKDRLELAVTQAPFTDEQKSECRSILNPPPAQRDHEWEDEQRKRRDADSKIRAESRRRIEENIERLRDGSDYSAIYYLVKEMRHATSASNSTWGQTNIALIERVYGQAIAAALRTGLSASWRRFTPPLKSTLGQKNLVENGVMTGLTALALDYRDGVDFSALSPEDATVATHYALRELNQFPHWFTTIAATKPAVVAPILMHEVRAELAAPKAEAGDIINLREVRRNKTLALMVGRQLIQDLPQLCDLRATALNDVLELIDAAGISDPQRGRTAAIKTKATWSGNRALALVWLREWLKAAPSAAIDFLQEKLVAAPSEAIDVMKRFLLQIDDDIKDARSGAYLRNAQLLQRLIPLAYKYVPVETDPEHEDVYTVTDDDEAREARGRLAGILETIDGMAAHDAILAMMNHPDVASIRHAFERAADRHAARAVESEPWSPEDVRDFATFYSRDPANAGELFRLVCERLEDIKDNIETDDLGDKGLVDAGSNETRLQRYFAGRVERDGPKRYDVVREPEVANHKKPDFRCYHVKAGTVTVEVKPLDAGRYTFEYLKDTISTQLVGQYMKAAKSKHGILLLCLLKDRRWDIAGKKATFAELLTSLRAEAFRVRRANAKVENLAVIGIDMSAWKSPKNRKTVGGKKKSAKGTGKKAKQRAGRRRAAGA